MDSYQHMNSKVTCLSSYFELYIKDLDISKNKLLIKYVLKSNYDEPLLIWNTGIIIGSQKIDTMNLICDLVRFEDFESTIEIEIPNVDKEYIKYANDDISLLFQIDEDENTVEHVEINFSFNLFLSKEGKRQLSDIQNTINFPNKIIGIETFINRPIPFIRTWDEVIARYSVLDKHSRSTKKLSEWGIVLSSAFLLNPTEASKMWQDVIDCNITDSKDYIKYFLNQIFHKIRDNLKIKYAADFLFMNSNRVELMCETQDERYCVIGYHLENNDIDSALKFLIKYTKNVENYLNLKLYFYDNASEFLKGYSPNVNLSHNTYKNITPDLFYIFMKKASGLISLKELDSFADVFKLVYDQQQLNDVKLVQSYINVIFDEYELLLGKGMWYERILLGLISKFIYLERNVLDFDTNIKKLAAYSPEFLKHLENHHVFNDDEYKWYLEYVKNNRYIRQLLFTSKKGGLSSYEESYLNELAQNSKWDVFLEYSALIINSGDFTRARTFFSYIDSAVKECCSSSNVHNHSLGLFKLTVITKPVYSEAFKDFEESNILKFYITLANLLWNIEDFERKKQLYEIIQYFYDEFAVRFGQEEQANRIKNYFEKNQEGELELKVEHNTGVICDCESNVDSLFDSTLACSRYKIKSNSFAKHQIVFDSFSHITKNILLKIQSDLKTKNVILHNYISNTKKPQRVYIVTSDAKIIRETTTLCYTADTLFCEYVIRLIEYYMRNKVGYVLSKLPLVPVLNDYDAIYYCHPNGNKGYYRLVDPMQQRAIIKEDENIYHNIEKLVLNEVNAYFSENNDVFEKVVEVVNSKK